MEFKILFENGNPLGENEIVAFLGKFNGRFGYQRTVRDIIKRLEQNLDHETFLLNTAQLMTNFKMTRNGVFKGVSYQNGKCSDPNGILTQCMTAIDSEVQSLRNQILMRRKGRHRILVDFSETELYETTSLLWRIFKKLLPICMSDYSWGAVAASKIVFAVLPEVSLPIDNYQWKRVFQTFDCKEIITVMASEIKAWESEVGKHLDTCDQQKPTTLPAVYNVMAMEARGRYRV